MAVTAEACEGVPGVTQTCDVSSAVVRGRGSEHVLTAVHRWTRRQRSGWVGILSQRPLSLELWRNAGERGPGMNPAGERGPATSPAGERGPATSPAGKAASPWAPGLRPGSEFLALGTGLCGQLGESRLAPRDGPHDRTSGAARHSLRESSGWLPRCVSPGFRGESHVSSA